MDWIYFQKTEELLSVNRFKINFRESQNKKIIWTKENVFWRKNKNHLRRRVFKRSVLKLKTKKRKFFKKENQWIRNNRRGLKTQLFRFLKSYVQNNGRIWQSSFFKKNSKQKRQEITKNQWIRHEREKNVFEKFRKTKTIQK